MAVRAGEVKLLSRPAHMSSIRLSPISDTSGIQNVMCNGNVGAGLRGLNYKFSCINIILFTLLWYDIGN